MRKDRFVGVIGLAGIILSLTTIPNPSEAQTVLNIGGSSAGRNFATDVPLNLCDAAPLPTRFSAADGNKITWTCNRGGLPVIMRYSAGTSYNDGINKLLQLASNPASNMQFLDHTVTAGCTGPSVVTRPSDGKQYNWIYDCSIFNTINLPVHIGASDVQGASFHQSGPLGTTVSPADDSSLNSVVAAIVPFSIFVGKGVVKDVAGAPGGPIAGLSRLEVERIFSKQVTDWRQLGYGTVTDAAPGTLEATSPITLCLRSAGSGTKAAFDEIVMINATETLVANATSVFSSSSSGAVTCVAGNRRSIGYMNSDEIVNFGPLTAYTGLGYTIRLDGGLAYDAALVGNEKRDLKCGKYAYWTGWRLNRRTTSEGAAIDALAQAYVDNASAQATISIIRTGAYWASDEEMAVSKNVDKGPLIWKAGAHPECR
jgi:hypothetical protein